jgi:hypothetical protein
MKTDRLASRIQCIQRITGSLAQTISCFVLKIFAVRCGDIPPLHIVFCPFAQMGAQIAEES